MKHIVIIGAGPAGLTAAYELLKTPDKYHVTILEESGAIGGISRTVRHGGNRMDIGGHRFFSKDDAVNNWWQEIMPVMGAQAYDCKVLGKTATIKEGGPDPETEDRVMLVRDRVSRIYYRKKFFDYPVSLKAETIKNMGFVTTVRAGCSYLLSTIAKREEDSLENFYINRFGKTLYSMFFEGYTEKLWGRHPRDIAADWGSQRVKGLSIRAVIKDMLRRLSPKKGGAVETSLIEEFYYPKFGPGQLWEAVADEIEARGGTIHKHCRVTNLQTENGHVTNVIVETMAGKGVIPVDIVLSSMPLKDLVSGMNDVPIEMQAIAEGLPYRDFVTVGLLVDKLALKNETDIKTLGNIVPDCWIYVQDTGVKLGRIQIFNNWSPYMVADPDNTVWIGLEYFCTEGDDFWSMDEKDCVEFAANELLKMGVLEDGAVVRDSHRERVKKAYPAYFDTYSEIGRLIDWLNTFDNLFCIGRNGQHRYNNMDHSMVTAFEAVSAIRKGSSDRTAVWNVNTEKEYHEERTNTANNTDN